MNGSRDKLISPRALIRLASVPLVAILLVLVGSDRTEAAPGPPCKCFVPNPTLTLSTTDPGAPVDSHATFNIGLGPDGLQNTDDDTGDYNFGGVVTLTPPGAYVPADADIPDGAIVGNLSSQAILGLVNGGCNTLIPVAFTYMEATTDINNTIEPLAYGQPNDLSPLAGDLNQDGNPDIKPPPAVTKYPSYLNAIFDPDWVDAGPDKTPGNADDTNGPLPPLKPRSRFAAATKIASAGNLWVILQTVIFDPGTKLPRLPAFDPSLGFISVTVLQDPALPPSPSAVTDFCTPLVAETTSFGTTQDNPDTPGNEGGVTWRKNPDAPGDATGFLFAFSQRDADGDGFENSLDPCPFHADTVWNARASAPSGDSDQFAGTAIADGIPDTCDPTPTEATAGPPANQPTDHDGDGFPNRGDNCPTTYNPDQADNDKNEFGEKVGDGIGDACDTPGTDGGTDCVGQGCRAGTHPIPARSVAGAGPDVPDGGQLVCIRAITAHIGGDPNATVGECAAGFPGGPAIGEVGTGGAGAGGAAGAAGAGAGTAAGRGAAAGGAGAGGVGGPASGVGSLSPVGSSVPAWAAIAAGLGVAGVIGSIGTLASRFARRRRNG